MAMGQPRLIFAMYETEIYNRKTNQTAQHLKLGVACRYGNIWNIWAQLQCPDIFDVNIPP